MSVIAIVFLVLAIVIVWGGLVVSVLYLRARPERTEFPTGGDDDSVAAGGS